MSIIAEAQDFSITIDAEKDVWYNGLTGPADGLVYLPAACYVTNMDPDPAPSGPPDNDADISAFVWMAHDSSYLYLYTEVKDDIVNGSNGARYLNDCIELKFDPEPSEGGTYTAGLNTRLTALGDASVGGIDNLTGLPNYSPVEGEDYARKITGDGYALEFRLPIENIHTSDGRMLSFNASGKMGLAINIGDNDSGDRDNMLQWSAGHINAAHNDPKYLGTVTFLADHKLGFEAVSIIDPTIVNENAEDWYSNPNPTGINDETISAESYKLLSNYPNPFNPNTNIQFQIPNAGHVALSVYNSLGQQVATLIDRDMQSGLHNVTFNAAELPSGIYFYKIQAGSFVKMNKMLLLK